MNITIIANGEFPTKKEILDNIAAADRVVCCDGAFEKYVNVNPNLNANLNVNLNVNCMVTVVGDGDSLSSEVLREAETAGIAFEWVKVEEQEMNDLTKAVRYVVGGLRAGQPAQVDIVGATGLREDHTLGNVSLLAYYMEQYPAVRFRMLTDHGTFLPVRDEACIATRPGQQVSLFSLTPDVPVTVEGLKWPIENRCLTQWWQGTLNEAAADSFTVRGGTILVYLCL